MDVDYEGANNNINQMVFRFVAELYNAYSFIADSK